MKIKIGSAILKIEEAGGLKKAAGLMFRPSLRPGWGMLFSFKHEARLGMWMFGMRFPIDIIWISNSRKVVDIAENAKPWALQVFYPKQKARYVLEVGSGFCEKNSVKTGAKAIFISSSPC